MASSHFRLQHWIATHFGKQFIRLYFFRLILCLLLGQLQGNFFLLLILCRQLRLLLLRGKFGGLLFLFAQLLFGRLLSCLELLVLLGFFRRRQRFRLGLLQKAAPDRRHAPTDPTGIGIIPINGRQRHVTQRHVRDRPIARDGCRILDKGQVHLFLSQGRHAEFLGHFLACLGSLVGIEQVIENFFDRLIVF